MNEYDYISDGRNAKLKAGATTVERFRTQTNKSRGAVAAVTPE